MDDNTARLHTVVDAGGRATTEVGAELSYSAGYIMLVMRLQMRMV